MKPADAKRVAEIEAHFTASGSWWAWFWQPIAWVRDLLRILKDEAIPEELRGRAEDVLSTISGYTNAQLFQALVEQVEHERDEKEKERTS